jgi:uncharacterized protein
MEICDIKIDKEGIWYYRGAHMFRKDILCIFFENLKIDDSGKYLIELQDERCYLDVEDTAFVVTAVYKTRQEQDSQEFIYVHLTDDSLEKLDLSSLNVGADNIIYCKIKAGKFKARFSRKSYYQLAEFIEHEDCGNSFFINLNGERYTIKHNSL